jgi:hypothetical protein
MGAPRLSLSQMFEIERQKGGVLSLVPKIEGFVQATLRELPFCSRCGARMWLPEVEPRVFTCDHCGHTDTQPGPIVKQVAQHNVITDVFYEFMLGDTNLALVTMYISNDDQMHSRKTAWFNTYANSGASAQLSASVDYANRIWTWTNTYSAPTAPGRYVRWVGLAHIGSYGGGSTFYTYATFEQIMSSGTKLTSELYQTSTQTLEIVYKYIFSEAV